jgi:L-alanine-DL-glutamate epimerase-like enolase superfamily enzyme
MAKAAEHIRHVEARLVRLPIHDAPGDAIQRFNALEVVMVTVTDLAGEKGVGFGYTIGAGGSAILELLRAELLPKILGADTRRITAIHSSLTASIHALTPGCITSNALAAIDIALWDLAAKRRGLPLHMLLGGAQNSVPVYNTDVGWLSRPLDEMVTLARQAVERDAFRALKLKVGKPDALEDAERVAAVRAAIGPHIDLMIDANQAWSLDEAIRRLKLLQPYNLVWIEEPMEATNVSAHRELVRHISIPIAAGESLYHPAYFHEYLQQGAMHICQPDIARLGGITPALVVCQLAAAARLRIAPHVSPELSIALASAVPNSMFVEYIPHMEPLLKRRLRIKDGYAMPFESPGHGIQFDPATLDKFTVDAPLEAAA